jgi:hypothetical protein
MHGEVETDETSELGFFKGVFVVDSGLMVRVKISRSINILGISTTKSPQYGGRGKILGRNSLVL